MRLLDRLCRHRAPDPLAHDTDWRGQLDDLRDELTARRTRRAIHTRPPIDRQANRGREGDATP